MPNAKLSRGEITKQQAIAWLNQRPEGAMLNELLACPFCGKKHALEVITGQEFMDDDQEFWQHSDSYAVICNAAKPNGKGGCGAMGGFAATEQ